MLADFALGIGSCLILSTGTVGSIEVFHSEPTVAAWPFPVFEHSLLYPSVHCVAAHTEIFRGLVDGQPRACLARFRVCHETLWYTIGQGGVT